MNPGERTAELTQRYVDGLLSDAERRELGDLLDAHPETRPVYLYELQLHAALSVNLHGLQAGTATARPATAKPARPVDRPRRFAWLPLAAAAVLALVGAGAWYFTRPASLALRVGEARGKWQVTSATGRDRTAVASMKFYRGDRVTVERDAVVSLEYTGEATRIELRGASASFTSADGGKRIRLATGRLTATVAPQRLPLEIQTPQAVARVVGTRFSLEADAATTRLEVMAGRVRLTRAKDRAAVDVPAGHQAAVASGAELKVEAIRPPGLLLDLDFEDRTLPERTVGTVVAVPAALGGSRYCVAGENNGRLFLVNIRNGSKALLTYRTGAVLSFDYWVRRETWALDVYFWNETQSVSRGFTIREPVQERWTRVVFPLTDVSDHAPHDGDLIWDLSVQTTPGGNELFVDNLSIETRAAGAVPGK